MHLDDLAPRPATTAQRGPATPLSYTLNDAAHITSLSRSTLYRHAAAGRLRLVKVGGRTLVNAASLRALIGSAA
jgi:excisionase family DNA binding protein